mgnify:CR=1 FL=1
MSEDFSQSNSTACSPNSSVSSEQNGVFACDFNFSTPIVSKPSEIQVTILKEISFSSTSTSNINDDIQKSFFATSSASGGIGYCNILVNQEKCLKTSSLL